MAKMVMKFGGSSLATIDRRSRVADFIAKQAKEGHQIVVVPSAFGDETDELLKALCEEVGRTSVEDGDAVDEVLHIGERKSAAFLAINLRHRGVRVKLINVHQIGLIATEEHGRARIRGIRNLNLITSYLEQGYVVIVAGFQAMTEDGRVVTLGRGGSDLSAVFFAAKLGAECIFYKDVPYIVLAHPRYVTNPKPLRRAALEQALPIMQRGAGVLMERAIRAAMANRVSLRVCLAPSFGDVNEGTILVPGSPEDDFEGASFEPITALTVKDGVARIAISNIPDEQGALAKINRALTPYSFQQFHDAGEKGRATLVCLTRTEDTILIKEILNALGPYVVNVDTGLVVLTLLTTSTNGSEPLARRDEALARAGVNIHMVIDTPEEGVITTVVSEDVARSAAQAIAEEFNLVEK